MNRAKSPGTLSDSILEEACGWFADCNEGELDARGRAQFNQWLRRSPEHVRAYLEVAAAWEDSTVLAGQQSTDVEALVARALAMSNVIALESRAQAGSSSAVQGLVKRPLSKLAALAASMLIAVAGGWLYINRNTYATQIGEQRLLTLTDGSTVELNSRSRVKVRFSERARVVELLEGQVLFQVKKDSGRPFIVHSGEARIRAIGTEFDVYRKRGGTVVTVLEGRVAVLPHPDSAEMLQGGAGTMISAGEQLTLTPKAAPRPVRTNPAAATAWTQRKLIFNETPLPEVIEEFNRYSPRRIVLEDATLASFHIRGNFETTDADRFVQFMRDRFGVTVTEDSKEIRIASEK